MKVERFTDLEALAPFADRWSELSGANPFRSWQWNSSWWRHYGDGQALAVLGIFDGPELVGIAPWYLRRTALQGKLICWLGDGEVCSEYASVLTAPGRELAVGRALADWISRSSSHTRVVPGFSFDRLVSDASAADDRSSRAFFESMSELGFAVYQQPGARCWRLKLPTCWEDYLGMLSKSHRKQLRRLERRMLESGRAVLTTVSAESELPSAFETLVELHQRRWNSKGASGCFASSRFLAFHREVAQRFLERGWLRLQTLSIDGQPAAAEYHFADAGVIYAYQSGVEPSLAYLEPGRLATIGFLQKAIDDQMGMIDFLRGDEAYKAHYRAVAREILQYRVIPDQRLAQFRQFLWSSAERIKRSVQAVSPSTAG